MFPIAYISGEILQRDISRSHLIMLLYCHLVFKTKV